MFIYFSNECQFLFLFKCDILEEVYIISLCGVFPRPSEVSKLKKATYVIKQAYHVWIEQFYTVIKSHGFHYSDHASTLFLKFIFSLSCYTLFIY